MQLTFGSGEVFAQMITDAYGNRVQNATPVRIMGLQEMSVDLSAELKEFYGQNRYPLAVAQGKVKVSGKMKGALINGLTLNTLFFGGICNRHDEGALGGNYGQSPRWRQLFLPSGSRARRRQVR
ncbi:TPA: hypothetical protein ACFB5S_001624 [Neisseria gonorrhoeae]